MIDGEAISRLVTASHAGIFKAWTPGTKAAI